VRIACRKRQRKAGRLISGGILPRRWPHVSSAPPRCSGSAGFGCSGCTSEWACAWIQAVLAVVAGDHLIAGTDAVRIGGHCSKPLPCPGPTAGPQPHHQAIFRALKA